MKRLPSALASAHDHVSRASFGLAACLLAVIAGAFAYEVVARYVFSAPTEWASTLVSYAMLAAIFLAMPELTRLGSHVSINVLSERLSASHAALLGGVVHAVAAAACLFAAWFCSDEAWGQFSQEVWTPPPFSLPKWTLTIFIPYGFFSSAVYFVRQIGSSAPDTTPQAEAL